MLLHVRLRSRTLDWFPQHVKCRLEPLLDRRKSLCYKDNMAYDRIL